MPHATRALRALLSQVLDYAGLYPPASLSMTHAVEAFFRARSGEQDWILSRFICPATRLKEFSTAAAPLLPGTHSTSGYREHADIGEPWRLSVLIESSDQIDVLDQFNHHHSTPDHGLALADMIEVRAPNAAAVDDMLDVIPEDLFPFFELPTDLASSQADVRGFIAALAGNDCGAKIRTGGVTPAAFPSPQFLADFLAACLIADVPFKATAGLHHPLRGTFPLTYEKNSPTCTMHGFFNLFAAAALFHAKRLDRAALPEFLDQHDPAAIVLTDEGLTWKNKVIDPTLIAKARETFCLSFGSCSFDEPVQDLTKLGWL